ncbi:MAG: lytic transglycosylase domain-containing protein [Acidobacteriota bacterium]|nr:lytic transglycosylase domain-containing protein [Acidobacteriota bacterium]
MFRIAALAASMLLFATAASAEILVFKSGQSMSVRSYRVDGDLATAVLRAGGEVTFPAAMITRVDPDEVPYPEPVDEWPIEAVPAPAAPIGVPDAVLAARPFADLIAAVAASHQVDARLIHAVIEQESNYQARARSKKGARGLMQLMPATARQYGVRNSYDPKANIEAGVRHLKDLLSRLELPTALAAYNAGEGTIRRYGGLPPFPETQNYVRRILQRVGR